MPPFALASNDVAFAFLELGVAAVALGLLARFAFRLKFSSIPLYLIAGLMFGNGGFLPVRFSGEFVQLGSEFGVVLLLFMLGLEYTGHELSSSLQQGLVPGIVDLLLNFTPGFVAGIVLGLGGTAAFLLGGVTYITSSSVVAKTLGDLGRLQNPETPAIIGLLVIEDLAMAAYLPVVAVLVSGKSAVEGVVAVVVALLLVGVGLWIATKHGRRIGRFLSSPNDEGTLLTIMGLVLVVAGLAQQVHISAAVGAFLVGVAISGSVTKRIHRMFSPLRDLFAALFFLFFGLQVDPTSLLPALPVAVTLALVTGLTKIATGWIAAGRCDCGRSARLRAGAALVARGEFSVVIAGLGTAAGIGQTLGPIAACYVLLTAILGPVLTKFAPKSVEPTPEPA